ncbi:EndoU domain-containing protein [Vallitalea guaymasensis]|uniref:EndoU domain-containing protein n=1 Tax=Vallitalea guaymasensis TaxID=1185412 RepID=UPI0027298A3B|nr:EndoU domain-containing protein [Vallitalea guaymasensis]
MHAISIKSEQLSRKESQLKSMALRIQNTKDCLSSITNSLDTDIKYSHNIDYELNRLYKDIDNIELQLYRTGDFLRETGKVYHETEIKLELEFNKLSLEITDNYYTNNSNTPLPIMKEESFFDRLGNKLKSGIKHLVDFFTNSNEKVNNESLPYYKDNNSNFVIVNDYLQPDPYMYYTYDTKTNLESKGYWPTWVDIDKTKNSVFDYLGRSSKQIIMGNYTDEVTLLGTGGQIGLGILGLDAPMDIRDIVCDFHKWEWSWGHVGQTLLDMAALIPIVGALKYTDEVSTLAKGVNKSNDLIKNIDKTDELIDVIDDTSQIRKSIISDEMKEKILSGRRKSPNKNQLIGGHSPKINNGNPNYAVEVISKNADGTKKVKFTTQLEDGKLAKIKTSTLFPDKWSDNDILKAIEKVGNTSSIGVRTRDGATLHRAIVNNVQIEVIKIGDIVKSGYPTGGGVSGLLTGFE